jgi:hypothetical protein
MIRFVVLHNKKGAAGRLRLDDSSKKIWRKTRKARLEGCAFFGFPLLYLLYQFVPGKVDKTRNLFPLANLRVTGDWAPLGA